MKKRVINYYPSDKNKESNHLFSKKVIFSLILIFICIVLIFTKSQIVTSNSLTKIQKVEIKAKDSLWKIVKKHYSAEIDIRKKVYLIKEINGLSSVKLYPGQVIKIPKA